MSLRKHKPLKAVFGNGYLFAIKFDTNNNSTPDGVSPNYGSDCAVTRTDVNTYAVTFAADKKPFEMIFGEAEVLGAEPQLQAKVVSYTASTGVLVIELYDEDDTSGISAKTPESNNKTVQVLCVFRRLGTDVDF
jgi:hypothetical protein